MAQVDGALVSLAWSPPAAGREPSATVPAAMPVDIIIQVAALEAADGDGVSLDTLEFGPFSPLSTSAEVGLAHRSRAC